jgi:hypothetical protein
VDGFQERLTAVAVVPARVTWRVVGASGTAIVVIGEDWIEGADENPEELFATTVKVYCTPTTNPVSRIDVVKALAVVTVAPPGLAVTV